MAISGYFSDSYSDARTKFRDACVEAGALLESHAHPHPGPDGETLTTDIAWIGPRDAEKVLLTISATHGVEGYCGSGAQVATLRSGLLAELPPDIAVMMIHAINPHGFAWSRRVTEGNVDLNRNYADFASPLPDNPGYRELHDAICPKDWTPEALAEAQTVIEAYRAEHGPWGLQSAVASGQYSHPDGLFYGGQGPVWSRETFIKALQSHLGAAKAVASIDYHTGLGPYGYGERICVHPADSNGDARVAEWYGDDFTRPTAGTAVSPQLTGTSINGIAGALPHAAITGVTLEYGTRAIEEVLQSLRADNWLHLHGDLDTALGRDIKAEIRRCFYPDADDWKEAVWERGLETQRLAIAGLAGS
jgi:hypothetical protein